MTYSSAFDDKQSQESQNLFAIVKEAALRALGSARMQYNVELIGFRQGSVVVETKLVDQLDPDNIDIALMSTYIQSSQFKSPFKSELAAQNVNGAQNYPEADDQTVQLRGVIETEGIYGFFCFCTHDIIQMM